MIDSFAEYLIESWQDRYRVPQDPQRKLADFYLLTYIYQHPDPRVLGSDVNAELSSAGDRSKLDDLIYVVEDSLKILCDYLKRQFMYDLAYGLSSEALSVLKRNLLIDARKHDEKIDPQKMNASAYQMLIDLLHGKLPEDIHSVYKVLADNQRKRSFDLTPQDRLQKDLTERGIKSKRTEIKPTAMMAHQAILSPSTFRTFLPVFEYIFDGTFDSEYGGENWKTIAKAWDRLSRAKDLSNIIGAIDHVVDLQHNTGVAFNKNSSWDRDLKSGWFESVDDWVKPFLNFKSTVLEVRKLVFYVSGHVREIASRYFNQLPGKRHVPYVGSSPEFLADADNIEAARTEILYNYKVSYETASKIAIQIVDRGFKDSKESASVEELERFMPTSVRIYMQKIRKPSAK